MSTLYQVVMVANLGGRKKLEIAGMNKEIGKNSVNLINNYLPKKLTLVELNGFTGSKILHYFNPISPILINRIGEPFESSDEGIEESRIVCSASSLIEDVIDWCHDAPKGNILVRQLT